MMSTKLKPNQFMLDGNVITERPILFSTEMVKANLEDRKNQTRRIVKDEFLREWLAAFPLSKNLLNKHCPYGKPGDLLWVKETWQKRSERALSMGFEKYFFKAGWKGCTDSGWKPSIHLPKSGSRIWAMVEDIRVERVKDISEEDAIAEGIEPFANSAQRAWKGYTPEYIMTTSPRLSFYTLWASINGQASWNANPWVWVIKYRILSKTGRPSMEVIEENYKQIFALHSSARNDERKEVSDV